MSDDPIAGNGDDTTELNNLPEGNTIASLKEIGAEKVEVNILDLLQTEIDYQTARMTSANPTEEMHGAHMMNLLTVIKHLVDEVADLKAALGEA